MTYRIYSLRSSIAFSLLAFLAFAGCEDYRADVKGKVLWRNRILKGDTEHVPGNEGLAFFREQEGESVLPVKGVRIVAKSLKDDTRVETRSDCEGNFHLKDARFGPNEIVAVYEKQEDAVNPPGCTATTASTSFLETSIFVDVKKDETIYADIEVVELAQYRNTGMVIIVEDSVTGATLADAKVDLYSGVGQDFALVDSKLTRQEGIVVFHPFQRSARFPKAPLIPNDLNRTFVTSTGALRVNERQLLWYHAFVAKEGYQNNMEDFLVTYDGPETYYITVKLLPAGTNVSRPDPLAP